MIQTFVTIPFVREREALPFADDDNRYPESLVRHFLAEHTKKGDKVFDPFIGLGTTAFVCEESGRIPYGIEADRKRFEWTAGQIEYWQNITCGDAVDMAKCGFPKMDFAITSPPYMPKHHKWNPLYAGNPDKAGYDNYLKRMAHIFKQMRQLMKRGAYVIVQADNLHHGPHYTPLVRDLSLAIEKSLPLKGEIIVKWDGAPPDYPYTHCLIFKNAQQ